MNTMVASMAASMADPHLLLLGVLVGMWVLDRVLGAIERHRTTESCSRPGAQGRTVESNGPAGRSDDANRPSSPE